MPVLCPVLESLSRNPSGRWDPGCTGPRPGISNAHAFPAEPPAPLSDTVCSVGSKRVGFLTVGGVFSLLERRE